MIKERPARAAFPVLGLVLALAAGRAVADPAADVRAVLSGLQERWNAGDMAGYLDAYARGDAVSLTFGNRAVESWQELDALFRATYPDPERMGRFTIDSFAVAFPRPDVAIAHGRFTHTFPHEIVHGGYSHVLVRDSDGRWWIRHERTSRGSTETREH